LGDGFQHDDAFLDWQQERARRVEKNEQAFRAHNVRREQFEKEALPDEEVQNDPVPFVCECADVDCHQSIELTIADFEAAHSDAEHFTVKPGHVLPEFEEVAEQHDRYWVVRKFSPQDVARRVTTEPTA
jgi:hypothetical protein